MSALGEPADAPRRALVERPTGAGVADPAASPRDTVWGYIWSTSRRQQVVIVALSLVVAALELAPIELQRRIVDGAIVAGDLAALLALSLAYLGAILLRLAVKHGLRVYRTMVAEDVLRASRARLHALAGPDCAHGPRDGDDDGTRVSVLGAEVESVALFADQAYADLAVNGATMLGIIVYMALTEPLLALASLPFLVPQVLLVPVIQTRINALAKKRVERRRLLNDAVIGADGDAFAANTWDLRCIGASAAWWKSLSRVLVNGLNALGPLAVLAFGGWLAIEGETTLGVLVAFISGFQRLSDPARDLLAYYRTAAVTAERYRLIRRWLRDRADG